jgi:hypothetical protein
MPVDHGPLSELPLARYRPSSRLRLAQTRVARASAWAVDAHAHLGRWLTGEHWAVPASPRSSTSTAGGTPSSRTTSGRWHIFALDLPADVRRAVYADNASGSSPAWR